jgi:hypothetical protein
MREIRTSGLMSGDGKRGDANMAQATAPVLDSTMARRCASSVHRFSLQSQSLTLNRVAGFWRTRRVKEGFHGFASVPAAFGPLVRIQMENPG